MAGLGNALSVPHGLRLFQRKSLPANCLSSDAVGDCVYVTGPRVSANYQVAKADPSDTEKMPAIGVIVSKSNSTTCQVQVFGEVTGLYTGFSFGVPLFVGASGRPSHTAGQIPQSIGIALDADVVLVSSEFGGGGLTDLEETLSFDFSTSSPQVVMALDVGMTIEEATVVIETAFDDPAASLQLGTSADHGAFLGAADIAPAFAAQYTNDELVPILVSDMLIFTISPGTSTQGSGYVLTRIKR